MLVGFWAVMSILVGVAIFVVFVLLTVRIMLGVFASTSGANAIMQRYPGPPDPVGQVWKRQTVMIGAVRYRSCTTVGISAQGLFLAVGTVRGTALIPWDQFGSVRPSMVYWRKAVQLDVGEPLVGKVTVFEDLYGAMGAYLPAKG